MDSRDSAPGLGDKPGEAEATRHAREVSEAMKDGPRGAFTLSAIAVGILLVGWLLFYFFLFLPRGAID